MSLKQYSREFLLSKRCHIIPDFSALETINPSVDILTKKGIKRILSMAKANMRNNLNFLKEIPSPKSVVNSTFDKSKSAAHFCLNSEDEAHYSGYSNSQNFVKPPEYQLSLQRNPPSISNKIQYSRVFLLSRKCVPNTGEILAHVRINQFKSSPFTQAGIKKILWARKESKILHSNENHKNSTTIIQSKSELDPNSLSFYPSSQFVNFNQKNPSSISQNNMDSTLTAEKENYIPSSNDLSHLEAQYEMKLKTMQDNYEKFIRELKSRHFKQIQDLKLQGRQNFEKTLGVANTVISVDSEEKRSLERNLRDLLNASEAKRKALDEENKILKQQLGDLENELAASKIQAEEDQARIRADAEQMMEAQRVALTEEADKAKGDFLQVFEAELECPICSEMFVEASILTTCSHAFCRYCIITWCRNRAPNINCPVCRAPHTEQNIQPFPLGQSILAKIEDKLPHDVLIRRQALVNERRQHRV